MVAKRSYDVNGISLQSCLLLSELQLGLVGCLSDSCSLKNKFLTKAKANYRRGRVGCPSVSRPLKSKFLLVELA